MDNSLVDLSYLEELSEGDSSYKYQVLSIFLDNTPAGMVELENMVKNTDDMEAISKQAHFLKSGYTIIKVEGMYDKLAQIEKLSLQSNDKSVIQPILNEVMTVFNTVHPLLIKEKEKYHPAS